MSRRGLCRLLAWWCAVAALMACQPRVQFAVSDSSCQPPGELKQHFQSKDSIFACFVVLWQGQPQKLYVSHPITLQNDGSVTFRHDQGGADVGEHFELPREARGKELIFRIYVMHPSIEPISLAQHTTFCEPMGFHTFNCFSPTNPRCWMSFKFQPTSAQSTHKILALQGGACQVCEREVCDGKDNNCNGDIDEHDEVQDRPCP